MAAKLVVSITITSDSGKLEAVRLEVHNPQHALELIQGLMKYNYWKHEQYTGIANMLLETFDDAEVAQGVIDLLLHRHFPPEAPLVEITASRRKEDALAPRAGRRPKDTSRKAPGRGIKLPGAEIRALPLSRPQSRRTLVNAGYLTIRSLVQASAKDLLAIPGFKEASLDDLITTLDQKGVLQNDSPLWISYGDLPGAKSAQQNPEGGPKDLSLLANLGLRTLTLNRLKQAGKTTTAEVLDMTVDELLLVRYFGEGLLRDLTDTLIFNELLDPHSRLGQSHYHDSASETPEAAPSVE